MRLNHFSFKEHIYTYHLYSTYINHIFIDNAQRLHQCTFTEYHIPLLIKSYHS